ncbi:MAG: helicase HerA domain-containing protein [Anaerolineae bacterium]
MRRCQHCGTQLRPRAKFCPRCGRPAPLAQKQRKARDAGLATCFFHQERVQQEQGYILAPRPAGAQTLFGYEFEHLPDWLSLPHIMGNAEEEKLTAVLRQWQQFVAQLWKWKGAAFALRFLSHPETHSVTMALLVRVRHHHIAQALSQELKEQLQAQHLTPIPITDGERLAHWRRPVPLTTCLLEVRQQEAVVPVKFGDAYVVYPFPPATGDFRMVWETLAHTTAPTLLSLYLEPVTLTPNERTILAQAASTAQTLADFQYSGEYYQGHWIDPQAGLVGTAYQELLRRLGQPFLAVAHLAAAHPPAAWGVARAVEGAVTASATSQAKSPEVPAHCDIVQALNPQAQHTLRHSIADLTLGGWEFNQASPGKERLRYLTDAAGATALFRFPVVRPGEATGVTVKQVAPGGAQGPAYAQPAPDELSLGTYLNGGKATIHRQALNRHGLIVGFTGSGKTNTCLYLLQQLWQGHQIPFLVIEPAKTEYRGLMKMRGYEELLVFTLGDEATSPFRLNPFELLPGIRVEAHISALKTCFNAALPQFGILPSIIEESLGQIYEEKDWYLTERAGEDEQRLFPTMQDMYRTVIRVAEQRGYAGEVHDNIRAAVGGRLGSLLAGSKGLMFNCQRSIPLEMLLQRPTILELDALSDQDKALTMMFLLTQLREYCKVNRPDSRLRHVTLIEEAHRILAETPSLAGSEVTADTKAEAVRFFSGALAEIRAYGEGFLIAEQSPGKLAADAIRNTNLKLSHMLMDAQDREVIAGSMMMDEEQKRFLGKLPVGQAAIFMTGYEKATFVRVPLAKKDGYVERLSDVAVGERMQRFRLRHRSVYLPFDGCRFCGHPCQFRGRMASVTRETPLHAEFQEALLAFDERADPAHEAENWRNIVRVCARAARRAGYGGHIDGAYCYFVHEIDFPFTRHMRDKFTAAWREIHAQP